MLKIELSGECVQPVPPEFEPTARTPLFPSEAEDEFAITVKSERHAHIHEFEMRILLFVGISDSGSYGKYSRILQLVRLAHASRKPEVSCLTGEYADRAADDLFFIGDEDRRAHV